MAKRVRRKKQPGRFRLRASERSELPGSAVPGQRYHKMGKPKIGFMAEARERVPNLKKEIRDQKYVARFLGTPGGVHEINVRHDDILAQFNAEQWVDLYVTAVRCVKMFWKREGQTYLREYNAIDMTYRTSPMYGKPERAKREFERHRVPWDDPKPMILDD